MSLRKNVTANLESLRISDNNIIWHRKDYTGHCFHCLLARNESNLISSLIYYYLLQIINILLNTYLSKIKAEVDEELYIYFLIRDAGCITAK